MSEEIPLSPRAMRILLLGAGAVLILGTLTWSMVSTDTTEDSAAETAPPPAAAPQSATQELGQDQVMDWLPYSADELAQAGSVAVAYAERAHSIDYAADVDGAEQRQALAELSTAEHASTLEAASSAAAARRELAEAGTVTTATAVVERIDRWTEGTLTLVLSVQSTTTSDDEGTTTDTAEAVLTLLGPSDWQVAGAGDAGVGQAGDTGVAAPDEE